MQPQEIRKVGGKELKILWQDQHQSIYTFPYLRGLCPCALCVNELTGERLLKQQNIAADLGASRVELVGNYAVNITFTDNHNTGLYKFDKLRKLCPCCLEKTNHG